MGTKWEYQAKKEMSEKERLDRIFRIIGKENLTYDDIEELVQEYNVEQTSRGEDYIIGFHYDGRKCYVAYKREEKEFRKIENQGETLKRVLGSAYS